MRESLRKYLSASAFSLFIRLLLELIIVFLGVYFAFLFNEYTSSLEHKKSKIQLLQGMNTEIEYFIGGAEKREPEMQGKFTEWQQSVKAGNRKTPLYFVMQGNALPTNDMWQVILSSDGINLLDVSSIFELSKYYTSFDIMLSKYQKLINFAEEKVIPFENRPNYFYLADGSLKPTYNAYIQRYSDFLELFELMIKDSKLLRKNLQEKIELLQQ